MITVSVNNKTISAATNALLIDVINEQAFQLLKGVAIAVNNKVIPKTEWNNHQLNNNDRIIIIKATQGG